MNNSINNNNLQVTSGAASPLKDHSNIQNNRVPTSTASETSRLESSNAPATEQNQKNSPSRQQSAVSSPNGLTKTYTPKISIASTPSSSSHVSSITTTTTASSERPLKCLETLAQKAGITFDEKYEVASALLTLEKSQSPAQQVAAPTSVPLQISQEQLQQLYLQQAYGGAVQVKQEFPNQTISNMELKQQIGDHNQQQVQQMQIVEAAPPSPHQPPNSSAMAMPQQAQQNTTINTMSPLQLSSGQMPADWGGRVQVVQQQIQNPQYLQGMYGGPQVLMNGNILTPGLGPQVQVIAAGKHFQGGQLTSQMLAQGKQMIGNGQGFSGTYTLPTIPSSQQQTLLFSPVSAVNVISSQQQQQQQNILPALTTGQANSNKQPTQQDLQKALGQKVLQKVTANGTLSNNQIQGNNQSSGQCVQVSQAMPTAQMISPIQQAGAQHMQFAPWNAIPQFQWTNGLSPQPMLAQNNRYIIATNQDGTAGLQFIQHNPQGNQTLQAQPQTQTLQLSNLQHAVQQQQQQQVIINIEIKHQSIIFCR